MLKQDDLIQLYSILFSIAIKITQKNKKKWPCMQHCQKRGLQCFNFTVFVGSHDDVIKWKHFPRNWPFVREIHRSPVNFPHKGQWRGALMFSLIYAWINDWVNNREAGDLRRQYGHYDVIVMLRHQTSWSLHAVVVTPYSESIASIGQIWWR